MPLIRTTVNGKPAWKFGKHGKAYTGKSGKAKALRQMRAMYANGYTGA